MAEVAATCQRCLCPYTAKRHGTKYCAECARKMRTVRSAEARERKRAEDPEAYLARVREWGRQSRLRNPEGYKVAAKKYRDANPERYRDIQRRSRDKHREAYNARLRAYCAENRDKLNARQRERYAANREQLNQRKRELRRMKKLLKQASTNPDAWTMAKAPELQECTRLRLKALNLPCGSNEVCIGCEKNTRPTASILNRGAWRDQYA